MMKFGQFVRRNTVLRIVVIAICAGPGWFHGTAAAQKGQPTKSANPQNEKAYRYWDRVPARAIPVNSVNPFGPVISAEPQKESVQAPPGERYRFPSSENQLKTRQASSPKELGTSRTGYRRSTGEQDQALDEILDGLSDPSKPNAFHRQPPQPGDFSDDLFERPRLPGLVQQPAKEIKRKIPAKNASVSRTGPMELTTRPKQQQPFTLAEQPLFGEHYLHEKPQTPSGVHVVPYSQFDFSPDPIDPAQPFDPESEMDVYQGKSLYANQRPLLEIGRPWYQLGELSPGFTFLGSKNLVTPQFIVFGDFRSAVVAHEQNADTESFLAFELNLFFDFKITSTERIHFGMTPLDDGQNSKFRLDDQFSFDNQLNPDIIFGYFEGDLGALTGGAINQNLPFDAPFAIGFMPLLFQNGVWLEDAFVGVAATIPARNSPLLDISNMDLTFFYGWDGVTSAAFADDNVNIYGFAGFVEALGGYIETNYAYLEDRDRIRNQSYHNISLAYSRRYGRFISNSIRVISNAGQSTDSGPNTADGTLILIENSLTTSKPLTFVPYFNFFAGFDRPQSAARAGPAGGVLRNTGILFEIDGMTNFPTLDASANDTFGGAVGFNILSTNFDQQLVLEAACVRTHGNDATRIARGDQYGVGFRYQLPLTNADILRIDGILGFYEDADDINGLRVEWRHKW